MKLIRVVNYDRCYLGNDGNLKPSVDFQITETLGDKEIVVNVKPTFKHSLTILRTLAVTKIVGSSVTPKLYIKEDK